MNIYEQQLINSIKNLKPKVQVLNNGSKSMTIKYPNGKSIVIPVLNNQAIASNTKGRF